MILPSLSLIKVEIQQIILKDNIQNKANKIGVWNGGDCFGSVLREERVVIHSFNKHFLRAHYNTGTILGARYRCICSLESSQSSREDR